MLTKLHTAVVDISETLNSFLHVNDNIQFHIYYDNDTNSLIIIEHSSETWYLSGHRNTEQSLNFIKTLFFAQNILHAKNNCIDLDKNLKKPLYALVQRDNIDLLKVHLEQQVKFHYEELLNNNPLAQLSIQYNEKARAEIQQRVDYYQRDYDEQYTRLSTATNNLRNAQKEYALFEKKRP